MTNIIQDLTPKFTGSALGAVGAWGLQEISLIMAITSSLVSITLGILGIIHLVKHWSKK